MSREGSFVDGVHVFLVRVYYEDTDAGGVVYYANYLRFAERARSEMLRALGIDQRALLADPGVVFVVRQCIADYRRPARLDDLLEVRSRIVEIGRASVQAEQTVGRDGADLVSLRLRLVCMTLDGRPTRLPAGVRTRLAATLASNRRGS